jgi:hypothetical protein
LSNLESKSASVDISISNINSVTASNIARLSNLESKSASVDISISNINQYTGSNDTKWTTLTNVTSSLIAATGSYATTGSNQFFGTQTFSGSVYIANDLVVQGSSSIQYISASSVSIGTNIVQLNTANPSVRFAGLTIIDSGSIGGSGSFLYDSLQDEFIFVHRGNGTNITSSHFVLGPETYDSLGNETYLTTNILSKGTGKEHLVDSCIFDNGTTTCIKNNLRGSGTACFASSITAASLSTTGNLNYTSGAGVNWYINPEANGPTIRLKYDGGSTNRSGGLGWVDNAGNRYDALTWIDGNVGIGTDPSFGKLSILGTDNTTISSTLWGTSTGAGIVTSVYNTSQTTDSVAGIRLITRNSGASVWNIYNISRSGDNGDLAFGNGAGGAGTEKVRILNNGNFGIGTSSAQYKTQITNTCANNVTDILALHNGSNAAGTGTGARLLFKLANFESSAETRKYASIEGLSTSDYSEDIALVFKTKSNNADPAERMRIAASGATTFSGNLAINNTLSSPGNLIETSTLNLYLRPASGYKVFVDSGDGLDVTSGVARLSNLRTSTLFSEFTKNLSGAYSNGTYYKICDSSELSGAGIYIVVAYVDTYGIGGGTYFATYASVPFYWFAGGSNSNSTQTLPTMLGTGHHNLNPPTIRLRLDYGVNGGLQYLEFNPNADWSNVQGTGGATVIFYVKRLGS